MTVLIHEQLEVLRKEWGAPRDAYHRGKLCPFKLACFIDAEIAEKINVDEMVGVLPQDLKTFWHETKSASLFQDVEFGQWGLKLLSPLEAVSETTLQREARPKDFLEGDLIIGNFLGDSDVLFVRCLETDKDFGSIYVATPIDGREDWFLVADSFSAFLLKYVQTQGDKYWE